VSRGTETPTPDRQRRAHRLELGLTVLFFVLFVAAGHLGIWFTLFGVDPEARLFGFPTHYTLALLAGWPVLLVLVVAYAVAANRLDDEIAKAGDAANAGDVENTGAIGNAGDIEGEEPPGEDAPDRTDLR